MSNKPALENLKAEFEAVTDPAALTAVAVDGATPALIVVPSSAEEAAAFLKYASVHDLKVAIRGGGTHTGLGNPPARLDAVLSTERLNNIFEYSQPDLMAGVQAGMRLADLQAKLEENGQFLPVEVAASGPEATVGGAIAINGSGPLRLAYGPARDWLIGVKFVLSDGTMAKGGGRVVKNVAGFDMMKLFIGSLGTLGLIHEMNFKLMPLPACQSTLVASFDNLSTACGVALKTIDAGEFPAALTVVDQAGAQALGLPDKAAVLLIQVRNTVQAVERQVRNIAVLCQEQGATLPDTLDNLTAQKQFWQTVTNFGYRDPASLTLKVSALPDQSAALLSYAQREAAKLGLSLQSLSHAGHGISWLTAQTGDEEAAYRFITGLTAWAEEHGGSLAAERIPLSLKKRLGDIWGQALSQPELKLMRGVKDKLDPGHILNPGRFVGGI